MATDIHAAREWKPRVGQNTFGTTQHTVRARFERSAARLLGRTGEGQEIMLSRPEDDDNEVLRHGLPTGFTNVQRFCSVHIDAQCVASVVG